MIKKTYLFLFLFLFLSACEPKTETGADPAVTAEQTENAETETEPRFPGTVYPYVFTDGFGNRAEIEKKPGSVLSLSLSVSETVEILGEGGLLVEAEPDLVIVPFDVSPDILDGFKGKGWEAVVLPKFETVNEAYDMIITVGKILDRNGEAFETASGMKAEVDSLKDRAMWSYPYPSVCYIKEIDGGEFVCAKKSDYSGKIITALYGVNIADVFDESVKITSYELLDRDPDVIFVTGESGNKGLLAGSEEYGGLSAVVKGRVYEIDDAEAVERVGPRTAEYYSFMFRCMYLPESVGGARGGVSGVPRE